MALGESEGQRRLLRFFASYVEIGHRGGCAEADKQHIELSSPQTQRK
jgi:hypothetical protein